MLTATEKYHFTQEQILDEECEIKAAMNDISCFSVLYDRYYIRLFRYIYHRIDSDDNAADLTSQVFLKAMLHLKSYRFMGLPFASWLYRIASNEIYVEYKEKKCSRVYNASSESLSQVAAEIDDDFADEEKLQWLKQALESLKASEMEFIEMRYFEKRSFLAIAEITGMTENNAKVKVHRIIQRLKDKVMMEVRQ